ncbi:MAG TPA: hypothetical protein VHA12_00295 [Candidatus Nanoarchaeia archaeon]|nr:hypothetical protein [Candidatus Nanoarchaeia archaeon]
MIQNKKAAIEMSIGTIVVLVLAMSMLILGLVLVKNIFSTANDSVEKVRSATGKELDKLFSDESKKLAINLPNNQIEIKKNTDAFVGFAIKNTIQGESGASAFSYDVVASSVETGCQLTTGAASNYLVNGKSKSGINLMPGSDPAVQVVQVSIPDNAPLCTIFYDINVKNAGAPYSTDFFIVKIVGN